MTPSGSALPGAPALRPGAAAGSVLGPPQPCSGYLVLGGWKQPPSAPLSGSISTQVPAGEEG